MGCVEDIIDDLNEMQTRIDDLKFDLKQEVYNRVKTFVIPSMYEYFIDMMKITYENDEYMFEELWYSKLKLTYMHKIAVYEDCKRFEEEYTKRDWL